MKLVRAAAVLALTACGPHAPQLLPPDRIESYCIEKEPRGTAIASILSSAADQPLTSPYPSEAAIRADIKKYGGVVGHWKNQPVYLPATAIKLNVPGQYVDVTDVAIDNQLEDAESRIIYVTVAGPRGPLHLVLRAYDVQNVCVEGTRLSENVRTRLFSSFRAKRRSAPLDFARDRLRRWAASGAHIGGHRLRAGLSPSLDYARYGASLGMTVWSVR